MIQSNTPISARLASAVPYIRAGARVADVGTDHAYLPIYLVREEIASAALACDINRGPIEVARTNIAAAGLEARIGTLHADGLHGAQDFHPDHVLIFGMGGELIVKILSEAEWVRDPRIRLVLQPMSRASTLRAWLLENGFSIVGETITYEDKYYQTLAAVWCGEQTHYSEAELLVGRYNIEKRPPLFEPFVRHEIRVLENIIAGKSCGQNADLSDELRMKQALEALL